MLTIFAMTLRGKILISKIVNDYGANFIKLVVGSRDRNIANDYYDEIKQLCKENNIAFKDRKDAIKTETAFAIAVAWRWLIEVDSNTKLIVFHDSILPRYRGFAPLVNSLINKETEIGVTALFADAEYDKGDIIFQSKASISYPIKINDAIAINNNNYEKCASHICNLIKLNKPIFAVKQNEEEATYSLWRDEDDYIINWNKTAEEIKRFIDATGYPYAGASTMLDGQKIRILDAEIYPDKKIVNRDAGKIIEIVDGKPVIVCGVGLLKINEASYNQETATSIFPLKKFRLRLK